MKYLRDSNDLMIHDTQVGVSACSVRLSLFGLSTLSRRCRHLRRGINLEEGRGALGGAEGGGGAGPWKVDPEAGPLAAMYVEVHPLTLNPEP